MTHIALVGKLHAGKTSIANALVANHGYTRIALADAVKDDVVDLLNHWLEQYHLDVTDKYPISREWIEENKPRVRPFLQWFGTDWARECIDDQLWIDRFLWASDNTQSPVVCDDVRFVNEAEALRRAGFTIVRILRPDGERLASAGEQGIEGHVSETELERIVPDLAIQNGSWRSIEDCASAIAERVTEMTTDRVVSNAR